VDTEVWEGRWPQRNIVTKHARHEEHGSGKFTSCTYNANTLREYCTRNFPDRGKPLHIVLKRMMGDILIHKRAFKARQLQFKKRKNMYFKVTLMLQRKHFEDIPLISVTNETAFS
jgi:hypothetical protein